MEPKLAILDETDSGLDIDALKIVASGVNKLKRADNAQLVITHYQRLLNYIVPDFVHVLVDGKIVRTGGKELALELEAKGYDWILKASTHEIAEASQILYHIKLFLRRMKVSHQTVSLGLNLRSLFLKWFEKTFNFSASQKSGKNLRSFR